MLLYQFIFSLNQDPVQDLILYFNLLHLKQFLSLVFYDIAFFFFFSFEVYKRDAWVETAFYAI